MPRSKKNGISEETKTILTVVALVFFYPLGLILMFMWMDWPRWAKILISFPIILALVAIVMVMIAAIISPNAWWPQPHYSNSHSFYK